MLTFDSEEGCISGVSSVVIFANETYCLSKKFNFFMDWVLYDRNLRHERGKASN